VLGQWLARRPAADSPEVLDVLVDPYGGWADPDRRVGQVLAADPTELCRDLSLAVREAGAPTDDVRAWGALWERAEAAAQAVLDQHLAGPPLSEPAIARTVVDALPDDTTLLVASSMPVRDVEWWGRPRQGIRVVSNRGANGIDGTVATSLGLALASPHRPTVALLGDLAFCYDISALLWASRRRVDCTLVVVDNNGGGIFSFLPQATALPAAQFESLWATPHDLDLAALAAPYGVAVSEVANLDELQRAVSVSGSGVRVILARCARADNVTFHAGLHRAIGSAVTAALQG
jgi:2-succinyl-5-enolpyruvyl-6-hydroxy-3-cyclohexene-1-carboxylate synthase